jgi:hypothetical protein
LLRNWFALQFNEPTSWYRKAFFDFNARQQWTTDGLLLGNGLNHNFHIQLPSQWWVHVGASANYSRNVDNRQFYSQVGEIGSDTTHYAFARLDQTTISLNSRGDRLRTASERRSVPRPSPVSTHCRLRAERRELSGTRHRIVA